MYFLVDIYANNENPEKFKSVTECFERKFFDIHGFGVSESVDESDFQIVIDSLHEDYYLFKYTNKKLVTIKVGIKSYTNTVHYELEEEECKG